MSNNPFKSPALGNEVELDPISCPDLASLPPSIPSLSTDDLVPFLRARLLEGLPYTHITPRVTLAVNPFQFVHATSDQALADWRAEYADTGADGVRGRLGPHVWATAQRAYYHMCRTGQDQAIVLRCVARPLPGVGSPADWVASTVAARRGRARLKRLVRSSRRSSTSPPRQPARRARNSRPRFPPPSSSSTRSVTPRPSRTRTHRGSDATPSCSSTRRVD